MSIIRATQVSRAPMAALMAVGVFWGAIAALVPDIKLVAQASDQQLGLALLMSALGGMGATYLVPRVGARLGRGTLPVVALFLVAAFFLPLFARSVLALGVALFFIGASVAMLDIAANVRISALESRHKLHLMNANHAVFSFAFGGAALVTGLARKAGYTMDEILPALAGGCVFLVLGMMENAVTYGNANIDTQATAGRSRPPWPAIILTGVILFAAFIGENSTEAWSALHLERTFGAAPGEGGYGPTVLGLVMGTVRLSGQVMAEKLGEARLILWSAVLGVVGTVVIGAALTQFGVLLGVAIVGVGMAVVVPSANSILGRLVREDQRAHAISRAWMFGMVGFFVGPSMMGLISEVFSLRVSFFVMSVVIALMIPATLALAGRATAGR